MLFSLALLFYDHLLMLLAEMRCIWERHTTGASVLFLTNRYGSLLYRLFTIAQISINFDAENGSAAIKVCLVYVRISLCHDKAPQMLVTSPILMTLAHCPYSCTGLSISS